MPAKKNSHKKPERRKQGFQRVSGLLQGQVREVGEKRGFPITRLLTHWSEVVGDDVAQIARPMDVNYSKTGLGATLTLLVPGPHAPVLSMKLESIRTRVNACYGYSAISRIRITQASPDDFFRGVPTDEPCAKPAAEADPSMRKRVCREVADISDDGLRQALELYGAGVLSNLNRK